jgi:hypothetical protein
VSHRAPLALAVLATLVLAPAPAGAETVAHAVTLHAASAWSARVRAAGTAVAVKGTGELRLVVAATDELATPATVTPHRPGDNDCAAADQPEAGTLNRTLTLTPGAGTALSVYAAVTARAKDGGEPVVDEAVEPLGPWPGMSLPTPGGESIDISVCVTD